MRASRQRVRRVRDEGREGRECLSVVDGDTEEGVGYASRRVGSGLKFRGGVRAFEIERGGSPKEHLGLGPGPL